MNHSAQRRSIRLAGFTLAALLVCAIAAQMAVALNVTGSGAGGGTLLVAGTEGSGVVALSGPEPAAAATASQAAATLQGRGGIASAAADTAARSQTPTDSNAWAAILLSLAAVLVGAAAWIATDRRRRLSGASRAAFCAQNPADALCGTA